MSYSPLIILPPIITPENIVDITIQYQQPPIGKINQLPTIIVHYNSAGVLQQKEIILSETYNYINYLILQATLGGNTIGAIQYTNNRTVITVVPGGGGIPDTPGFVATFQVNGVNFTAPQVLDGTYGSPVFSQNAFSVTSYTNINVGIAHFYIPINNVNLATFQDDYTQLDPSVAVVLSQTKNVGLGIWDVIVYYTPSAGTINFVPSGTKLQLFTNNTPDNISVHDFNTDRSNVNIIPTTGESVIITNAPKIDFTAQNDLGFQYLFTFYLLGVPTGTKQIFAASDTQTLPALNLWDEVRVTQISIKVTNLLTEAISFTPYGDAIDTGSPSANSLTINQDQQLPFAQYTPNGWTEFFFMLYLLAEANLDIIAKLAGVPVFTQNVGAVQNGFQNYSTFGAPGDFDELVFTEHSATGNVLFIKYGVTAGLCGNPGKHVWVLAPNIDIITGIIAYTDAACIFGLTGQNFITSIENEIFNIDSGSGLVGLTTGVFC